SQDPLEKNNLAEKERRIFNELAVSLQKHLQEGGRVPWQKAAP
ncbi:MAG: hypothetical protein K0Q55_2908, partial [Verrucomicrobia bacterium]|nr:hypothetical protein [Verrucomicrobiota bacterium]